MSRKQRADTRPGPAGDGGERDPQEARAPAQRQTAERSREAARSQELTPVSLHETTAAHGAAPLEPGREYALGRFMTVRVLRKPAGALHGEFLVFNGRQQRLGRVHWATGWRRYVFSPDYDVSFPHEYLRKLDQFLHRLETMATGRRSDG